MGLIANQAALQLLCVLLTWRHYDAEPGQREAWGASDNAFIELVRQLEQADFVSATSVDTATSGQEEGDQATVTVFFTVTTGEEQEETP